MTLEDIRFRRIKHQSLREEDVDKLCAFALLTGEPLPFVESFLSHLDGPYIETWSISSFRDGWMAKRNLS